MAHFTTPIALNARIGSKADEHSKMGNYLIKQFTSWFNSDKCNYQKENNKEIMKEKKEKMNERKN